MTKLGLLSEFEAIVSRTPTGLLIDVECHSRDGLLDYTEQKYIATSW